MRLKVIIVGSALVTLGQFNDALAHGMTPEFAIALMLATVRVCETTYPDMETSLIAVREAWQVRNEPLLTPIEKALASKKATMQSLVDFFVAKLKKENAKPERAICEQLNQSLADARNDAEFKAWFEPGNREFSLPRRPPP